MRDFDAGCTNFEHLSTILRDVDLTAPSSGSYVYDSC
jgi:hypothetical protein